MQYISAVLPQYDNKPIGQQIYICVCREVDPPLEKYFFLNFVKCSIGFFLLEKLVLKNRYL
jgi:hypothetical protein